jgi:hemolysin III
MNEVLRSAVGDLQEVAQEIKPRLRGWLHLVNAPLTLAAGIVLIALSPTAGTRIGSTVYTASALLLFTVSAIYHRGRWSPRVHGFLQRFDHANIFLLIAGSYTPYSLVLLHGTPRTVMLSVVWIGALLGCLFRIFWLDAPRWFYIAIYIALGWAAVAYLPAYIHGGAELGVGVGITVLVLAGAGGLLYTIGAVIYGLKRPDPWPTWFGFHEMFHTMTILAFVTHYVGVSIATYSLR